MKFLDLNGLKQVLKRVVKYDKGSTTNITVGKLSVSSIMPDISGSEFPEEFSKLRSQNLFLTIASILHTLKEKGIMQ